MGLRRDFQNAEKEAVTLRCFKEPVLCADKNEEKEAPYACFS